MVGQLPDVIRKRRVGAARMRRATEIIGTRRAYHKYVGARRSKPVVATSPLAMDQEHRRLGRVTIEKVLELSAIGQLDLLRRDATDAFRREGRLVSLRHECLADNVVSGRHL